MTIEVRERPPLRHHVEAIGLTGRRYRWAADAPDPANVPSGLRHSSTMPGGHESLDAVLPRDPQLDYPDLERLSTVRARDAAGQIVSEARLERAPLTSGDRMAISPSAVGWQAHLDDDKFVKVLYVGRALARWSEPSRARQLALLSGGYGLHEQGVAPDGTGGLPALRTNIRGAWNARPRVEPLYDAGAGVRVGAVYYDNTQHNVAAGGAGDLWDIRAGVAADDQLGGAQQTSDLHNGSGAAGYFIPTTPGRFAFLRFSYEQTGAAGTDGTDYTVFWRNLTVYGDHGLTRHGTPGGILDSDIVAHAVRTFAPLLNLTEGPDGTVQTGSFVVPHLAFHDPTTASEIVRQASRFTLPDWAVWDHRTFWWHARGARARRWIARVGPAGLEETGPQVDRLWESIVVQYQDVDGTARTVGPPGSGADTESELLKDYDPENPANKLGAPRRDLLVMRTATPQSAIEVGRRFLAETRLLDTSGRARFVGWVLSDRGVLHAFSHVRAGDEVSFADAADTSWRRIVRADHTHDDLACSVDLDAPPEALKALLERLDVRLVQLGIG